MSGVDIVDITDQAKPTLVGSSYLDGYARDVATSGSLAVAVDNPSGVYVFDMTNATPLEPITTLQSATAPQQIEMAEIAAGGGRARIAVLAGSEPYNPLRTVKLEAGGEAAGRFRFSCTTCRIQTAPVFVGTYPTASSRRRLAVKGSLVYIADGTGGVQILDISTPSKATVVARFTTAKPARDVAVGDSVIVVRHSVRLAQGSRSQTEGDVLLLRQVP